MVDIKKEAALALSILFFSIFKKKTELPTDTAMELPDLDSIPPFEENAPDKEDIPPVMPSAVPEKKQKAKAKKKTVKKKVTKTSAKEELPEKKTFEPTKEPIKLSFFANLIKKAEDKAKLEKEKEKNLELTRKAQEKEIKEYKTAIDKKTHKKHETEIKEMLARLDSGIKAIDKHDIILRNDIDQNLKLTDDDFRKIKEELKTEKEYARESNTIKNKITSLEKDAKSGKTDLTKQISELKQKYNDYVYKSEGIRRIILAKIGHIKELAKEVAKEEKKRKEMLDEKKRIIEIERLLARKRLEKKVIDFLRKTGVYKTKEDREKEEQERLAEEKRLVQLSEERRLEQEMRIKEEEKQRELEFKTTDTIEEIRRMEEKRKELESLSFAKENQKMQEEEEKRKFEKEQRIQEQEERKRFEENLRKTEQKREKEKEKLFKGNFFTRLFGPRKTSEQEEIEKAISDLKTPVLNTEPESENFFPGNETGNQFPDIGAMGASPDNRTKDMHESVDDVDYINKRIEAIRKALIEFDLDKAKEIYLDIIKLYNDLSTENKKKTFQAITDIYNERKSAERIAKR